MERSLFIFNFKWSKAIVLLTVVIVAIEGVVLVTMNLSWESLYRYSEPYDDDSLRFRAQLEVQTGDEQPVVLVLGSSQPREDVDAQAINAILTAGDRDVGKIVNLGVSGGWAIVMFLQLDLVLEKKPSAIIAMPYWRGFYQDYDETKTKLYLFSYDSFSFLCEQYGLGRCLKKYKNELFGMLLANIMPSYRYRSSFLSITARKLFHGEHRSMAKQFAHHKQKPIEYFNAELEERKALRLEPIPETAIQKRVFYEFAKRIKQKDIPLIVIEPPWHPMVQTLEAQERVAWEDYKQFITQTATELDFEYIERNKLPRFSANDFISFAYLNDSGRVKLSNYLVGLIRKRGLLG